MLDSNGKVSPCDPQCTLSIDTTPKSDDEVDGMKMERYRIVRLLDPFCIYLWPLDRTFHTLSDRCPNFARISVGPIGMRSRESFHILRELCTLVFSSEVIVRICSLGTLTQITLRTSKSGSRPPAISSSLIEAQFYWPAESKHALVSRLNNWSMSHVARQLVKNPVSHSSTRNIEARYHFIWAQQESGEVHALFIWSEDQLADLFTKPLPVPALTLLDLVLVL